MADKLRPITYGRTAALAAAIAVLLGSSSARAGSPTINTQGEVGQTDYSSLPFAGSIFAQSYGKDPSFAAFYRSMRAYETSMANGDTTLVLSPDSDFFKYFKSGPGNGK